MIGAYLDQLDELGKELGAPVIQGSTKNAEREALFDAFRRGEIKTLVVSGGQLLHRPAGSLEWPYRFRGRSGPGRRRRSSWAGCCVPNTTAAERCSTRWWPATASTPTTPRTASGSSPSRGTGYIITDADDLLGPAI